MTTKELKKEIHRLCFHDKKKEAAKLLTENIAAFDFDDDDDLEDVFGIACDVCGAGDFESMEILAAQEDFDINMRINGETLMTHLSASLFRNLASLRKVIELGGDVTAANRSGDTVCSLALKYKVSDVSEYLVRLLPVEELYKADHLGRMPFHIACEQKSRDVLAFMHKQTSLDTAAIILERGFDINTPCADRNANFHSRFDYEGKSALHIACAKGFVDGARFLILSGADVNLSDIKGRKPLFYAANMDEDLREAASIPSQRQTVDRHIEIIKLLCENGADVNTVNDEGETPLLATVNGSRFANGIGQDYEKIAQCLIDCGAKARVSDLAGQTPLHFSVRYAFKDITKQLIALNADVNARDKTGRTPMHYAVSGCKERMVKLLIRNGADKDIVDNQGVKPLDIASEKGYVDIVEMLI